MHQNLPYSQSYHSIFDYLRFCNHYYKSKSNKNIWFSTSCLFIINRNNADIPISYINETIVP